VNAPPVDLVRKEIVAHATLVVVKVGTGVLTSADGTLDTDRVAALAEQIHQVHVTGRNVVLVSSGAIGAGMGQLNLASRPTDLSHLQAAAAVGQSFLIRAYDESLRRHGHHAAQLLLTAGDFEDRTRYLNVRNTIHALFDLGAVPVVNENDTVSVDEIRFGDNDRLAALVTNLLQAPLLVILTTVDGLYDGVPGTPAARLISTVTNLADVAHFATNDRSRLGRGGMQSKLEAARTVAAAGENVIIANGLRPRVLMEILNGDAVGTLVMAHGAMVPAWKRWIGYTVRPRGRYLLDDGARRAVVENGRSLLAIGIVEVDGSFEKGDVVALCDSTGKEFARGLSNYSAAEARKIKGKRTDQIREILETEPYGEVIHRDNLAVT
jgi:glutamate 5-kinase